MFYNILTDIHNFSYDEMNLKMPSAQDSGYFAQAWME